MAAGLRDGGQLRAAVNGAEFGRLRQVNHPRLHDMLLDAACLPVAFHEIAQLRRIELAVCSGQGQHLVAVRFHRAGFMGGNVAAVGGNHPLPRAEDAGDDGGIGLRAADKEMYVRRLIADECADGRPRGVAARRESPGDSPRGSRCQIAP